MADSDDDSTPISWQLIGGHPALDLANTLSWRLDPNRRRDLLTGPGRLAEWWRQVSLATECASTPATSPRPTTGAGCEPAPSVAELVSVRALRDALVRLLDDQVSGQDLPPDDLEHVAEAWRVALSNCVLDSSLPARWQLRPDTSGPLGHRLALSVVDLLQGDLGALRRCDGAGCGWFFLDTTRNHSRRWCDPADCGNRTRVQRYARRRAAE